MIQKKTQSKILKSILIILSLILLFSGCQKPLIDEYNEISQKHSKYFKEASENFILAIGKYNEQKYSEVSDLINISSEKFQSAKNLSEQGKEIAQKLKEKEWLIGFRDIYIQMANIRIDQCSLLSEAIQSVLAKDNTKTQETINKMSQLNDTFAKMEAALVDIKNQHPESFD